MRPSRAAPSGFAPVMESVMNQAECWPFEVTQWSPHIQKERETHPSRAPSPETPLGTAAPPSARASPGARAPSRHPLRGGKGPEPRRSGRAPRLAVGSPDVDRGTAWVRH